jgi:hypothetical protein
MHGGSAPQVRKAAALRLITLVDPALGVLAQDLKAKDRKLRQNAAFDVLDRAGFKSADKLILEDPAKLTGFDADLSQLTDDELELARRLAQKVAGKPAAD